MTSGTLTCTVHKVENLPVQPEEGIAGYNFTIKVTVAGHTKNYKVNGKGHIMDVNHTFNFDVKEATGSEEIVFDLVTEKNKPITNGKISLADFLQGQGVIQRSVALHQGGKLTLEGKWTLKNTAQKYTGEENAKTLENATAVATMNPQRALSVDNTHRPGFLRVSFYYDATKTVYNYTTSFRLIAPVARFGESSADMVLQKITGKSLRDVDQSMLVPVFGTIDEKVDATISTVLVTLLKGQNYVIRKKDDAVQTTSQVVHGTVSTVSKATDYTKKQLTSVSTSAFGTVRSVTTYLVSHVPYLGAKIRA